MKFSHKKMLRADGVIAAQTISKQTGTEWRFGGGKPGSGYYLIHDQYPADKRIISLGKTGAEVRAALRALEWAAENFGKAGAQ